MSEEQAMPGSTAKIAESGRRDRDEPRASSAGIGGPDSFGAAAYQADFAAWCFQQADLLRQRRFDEADWRNLIEEIEDMGRSVRKGLRSSYRVLLAHLLKWEYQPEKRGRSWRDTINRERLNIEEDEADNRSLARDAELLLREAYPLARRQAANETRLPLSTFPAECPYKLEHVRDDDWLPGASEPQPDMPPSRNPRRTR